MGLELDDVPGLRRLEQPEGDGVERAAEMPAMRLDAELPPGLGIDLQHRRAGGAQVADEPGLFQLAGLEQPQDAAGVPRGRRPAEVVPERTGAGLADQRGAEVVAETVALPGLVGGVDRGQGRRRGFGELGHQHASSRSSRARASASTAVQAALSWRSRRTAMIMSLSRSRRRRPP